MTISQYLGFCPPTCAMCTHDLAIGKVQAVDEDFIRNYEHLKSIPEMRYVSDAMEEMVRESTKDHVIVQGEVAMFPREEGR